MPIEAIAAYTDHLLAGDWNEVHPSLRWEAENRPYMAAAYKNSEGGLSLAAGFHGEIPITNRLALFGEAGLATGYSGSPLMPFVRGGLDYDNRLRAFIAPAMNTDGDVGAVLGIENVLARW